MAQSGRQHAVKRIPSIHAGAWEMAWRAKAKTVRADKAAIGWAVHVGTGWPVNARAVRA
jgi:hypothetical protein